MQTNIAQCKAARSNPNQHDALQSNTKQCKATQSNATQHAATQSNITQCSAARTDPNQHKAMQTKTKQCKSTQRIARQHKALQTNIRNIKAICCVPWRCVWLQLRSPSTQVCLTMLFRGGAAFGCATSFFCGFLCCGFDCLTCR